MKIINIHKVTNMPIANESLLLSKWHNHPKNSKLNLSREMAMNNLIGNNTKNRLK